MKKRWRQGRVSPLFLILFAVGMALLALLILRIAGSSRRPVPLSQHPLIPIAGTGHEGYSGDGGPALKAEFHGPAGLAMDAKGNLYISDTSNHRIRKVTPQGRVSAVVGPKESLPSGSDGPPPGAPLWQPSGLAMDTSGILYVADSGHHRIVRVTPEGEVTPFAGNGVQGDAGDGGPALDAQFIFPMGVATDRHGSLFIADPGSHRIRKVGKNGIITTVAGNGERGFSGDGGPATEASLNNPLAVAVNAAGSLYIADEENHRVRKVSPDGIITTVAGSGYYGYSGDGGPATDAELHWPSDLALDGAGNLFISDRGNHRIRKIDTKGTITTVAGNGASRWGRLLRGRGDYGPAIRASLAYPRGLLVDREGSLYAADGGNDRVVRIERIASPVKGKAEK